MASVRVGSLFGIPIRLGASFLLVLPLLAYLIGSQVGAVVDLLDVLFGSEMDAGALSAGLLPWLLGGAAALGLFGSVLLHELGHAAVARRYGLHAESITLWFLGGLAQFAHLPEDWRQELSVAVAGPIVSVATGLACYAAFVLLPGEFQAALFVLGYLAVLNVALAAFNMLPGFPMDGGRVLRALLSRNRSRIEATQIAAAVGKAFAVVLALAGVILSNLFWILIGFFIYLAATSETSQVLQEAAFEGIVVAEIMTPAPELDTVRSDAPLAALVERMLAERHTGYPVVDGGELVGLVTLEDVQSVPAERREAATVGDVMSTDLQTVSPGEAASRALRTLQSEEIGRLLVTDADGELLGLLSRTDLMTVLEVAQVSRSRAPERQPTDD